MHWSATKECSQRGDNNFRCESDVAKAMEEALQLSRNIGQIYDKGDERDPTPPDPVAQLCEFVDQVMVCTQNTSLWSPF